MPALRQLHDHLCAVFGVLPCAHAEARPDALLVQAGNDLHQRGGVHDARNTLHFRGKGRDAQTVGQRHVHADAVKIAYFALRAVGRERVILRGFLRHAVQNGLIANVQFLKNARAGQVGGNFGLVQPFAIGELVEVGRSASRPYL